MVDISVIIPAKNEAGRLARCIGSLISGANALLREIIVVDCASTDATVADAMRFPVRLLQLKPNWIHSPAAARHIGTIHALGDYLFFIDADMRYERGFLEDALDFLRAGPQYAGVSGICREVHVRDERESTIVEDLYKAGKGVHDARFIGAAALYRARCLREAGGFNPYLRAAEEWDLARRLRRIGFKLAFIPVPMSVHLTAPIAEWGEFKRKKEAGYFFGIGQALRLSGSPRYLIEGLRYYWEFALFLACAGSSALVLSLTVSLRGAGTSTAAVCLPFIIAWAASCLRKRNIAAGTAAFYKWLAISGDIVRGFFTGTKDPRAYPIEPLILKGAPGVH